MPEFPIDPEEEQARHDSVWLSVSAGGGEDEDFGEAVFEDAETRDFYLSIPNIYELVRALDDDDDPKYDAGACSGALP